MSDADDMSVKFIGVYRAPGFGFGPETMGPSGIMFSCAYANTDTWAIDERGGVWQLCTTAESGMRDHVWVRCRVKFGEGG